MEALFARAGGSFHGVVDGNLEVFVWRGDGDRLKVRTWNQIQQGWLERTYWDRSTADGDTWSLSYVYPDNLHPRISGTEGPDICPSTSFWSLKDMDSKPASLSRGVRDAEVKRVRTGRTQLAALSVLLVLGCGVTTRLSGRQRLQGHTRAEPINPGVYQHQQQPSLPVYTSGFTAGFP